MPSSDRPLDGKRVLVVEDRYLIALEMCGEVSGMGGEVIGPASNADQACELIANSQVDLGLLDVNLDGSPSYPVAEALAQRGVPFIFLTGYDEWILPAPWRGRPQLRKPVSGRVLRDEVRKALS